MSTRDVQAMPEDLMRQASHTAEYYLDRAVKFIDERFGDGFAKQHPELIGKFMVASALDYHAAAVQIAGQSIRDAIEEVSQVLMENEDDTKANQHRV